MFDKLIDLLNRTRHRCISLFYLVFVNFFWFAYAVYKWTVDYNFKITPTEIILQDTLKLILFFAIVLYLASFVMVIIGFIIDTLMKKEMEGGVFLVFLFPLAIMQGVLMFPLFMFLWVSDKVYPNRALKQA